MRSKDGDLTPKDAAFQEILDFIDKGFRNIGETYRDNEIKGFVRGVEKHIAKFHDDLLNKLGWDGTSLLFELEERDEAEAKEMGDG